MKLLLSKILRSNVKFHEIFSRWEIQWHFYSKFQWKFHEFLTTLVTVFQLYFQYNQHHHHHFWFAPLIVRFATQSKQPPERSILSHAASAWWGFTIADDRRLLEAVIRRGIRSGFCSANQSPLSELFEAAETLTIPASQEITETSLYSAVQSQTSPSHNNNGRNSWQEPPRNK